MLLLLCRKGLMGGFHRCFNTSRWRSLSGIFVPLRSSHTCILTDDCRDHILFRGLLVCPWSITQRRGAKILGSDVRVGDIVQRKGNVYEVVKAQHTQQGRGGAAIQVEFRDVDKGTKVLERLRTDEPLETVFVEDKPYSYLYTEGGNVILMDPTTFEQIDVPEQLFGKASAYLKEDMTVSVQFYNGRVTSASIPRRVTCTIGNAEGTMVSSLTFELFAPGLGTDGVPTKPRSMEYYQAGVPARSMEYYQAIVAVRDSEYYEIRVSVEYDQTGVCSYYEPQESTWSLES